MKLFLSGGGSGLDSYNLDKEFIETIDSNKPVLYIPIAINKDKHPYLGCLNWLRDNFKPLNFDNFVMWTEEDLKTKTKEDFQQFSGIYIGGGSTYKLLKELKEFGTFDIIAELAHEGLPIYGGSAGAIILSKTIFSTGFLEENEVGISDFSSLNLVHGYDIWCHYTGAEDGSIKKYIKDFDMEKIIAIPENAGVIVTSRGIEVVGPGEIKVFDSEKRTLSSGDIFA